ncbi:Hachiman antiphage defense system protein HamA [Acidovorax sp. 69]|uniref:Hachiman antiphage defense system protein HamA n=1 Tax=Acidovorax sp. 69 TaxID=2035202 RepID=UPI000C238E94
MASRNSRLRVRLVVLLRPRLLCFMALLSGLQPCPSTQRRDSCRGTLGEVLCTTFVHEHTPFTQGIKRLRWKDHRNMSMRGDDVLGFNLNPATGHLTVLKAESKSGQIMSATTVNRARAALSDFGELPSPHAMSFVADRLTEPGDIQLRNAIDDAQLKHTLQPADVTHLLFAMSGNDTTKILQVNLSSYAGGSAQIYVGLKVAEHQKFIGAVFSAVGP